MLVIFSGLPGAGKTKLAVHAARQLGAALLSKDVIEAALWRSEIRATEISGWAAYEVMTALAAEQLRLGHSVVLDSVAATGSIRDTWTALAADLHVDVRVVECVCSDTTTHRSRMEARERGIPGWPELSWDDVERVRDRFEPWRRERLVLDAARPLTELIPLLDTYLG